MPTLAMRVITEVPDAWHQVIAPGGYESWSFYAHDWERGVHFAATLYDGMAFHPKYLSRYLKYCSNPTRVRPPLAKQYPGVMAALYREGEAPLQFASVFSEGTFEGNADAAGASIGGSHYRRQDGVIELSIAHPTVSAELQFATVTGARAVEVEMTPRGQRGEQLWTVADGATQVQGVLRAEELAEEFIGVGFHEHQLGTSPAALAFERIFKGHVVIGEKLLAFQVLSSVDGQAYVQVVRGEESLTVQRPAVGWQRAGLMMRCPISLDLGEVLKLSKPTTLYAGLFAGAFVYEAKVGNESGMAFCEVMLPKRLRWPILGRVVQRWIESVAGR